MAVVFKTLSATLAANVNELTFSDAIINSNSVIEVYYNSNDVYTIETWQDGTTIGIVTSDHNFPVGVKVTINNVISFEPYDDTDLVNRIDEDETVISGLADRLGTAEGDIDDLELSVDSLGSSVESLSTNKQDVLTAGDNITIEGNVISAAGGGNSNIYSTTETEIGTWIDGKPLYRRVFTGLSISLGQNVWTTLSGVTIPNGKDLVNVICYGTYTEQYVINCSKVHLNSADGSIEVRNIESSTTLTAICLEYTKETV